MAKERCILCNYIYNAIRKKLDNPANSTRVVMKRSDFKWWLACYAIPTSLHSKVIEHLEKEGYIQVKDKQNIILVQPEIRNDWFD